MILVNMALAWRKGFFPFSKVWLSNGADNCTELVTLKKTELKSQCAIYLACLFSANAITTCILMATNYHLALPGQSEYDILRALIIMPAALASAISLTIPTFIILQYVHYRKNRH